MDGLMTKAPRHARTVALYRQGWASSVREPDGTERRSEVEPVMGVSSIEERNGTL
jgi:hypothetical protein